MDVREAYLAHTAFRARALPLIVCVYPTIRVREHFFLLILIFAPNVILTLVVLLVLVLWPLWAASCTSFPHLPRGPEHPRRPTRRRVWRLLLRQRPLDTRGGLALFVHDDAPLWLGPAPPRRALHGGSIRVAHVHRRRRRERKRRRWLHGLQRRGAPRGPLAREECGRPVKAHPPTLVLMHSEEEADNVAGLFCERICGSYRERWGSSESR